MLELLVPTIISAFSYSYGFFSGVLNFICYNIPENSSSLSSLSLKTSSIDKQNL